MTAGKTANGLLRPLLSWLAIVTVVFVFLRLMSGDPVDIFMAQMNIHSSPETVAAFRAQWGLDASLFTQFYRWLSGFLTLDWGKSFETGRPVLEEFMVRIPYSIAIGSGGMMLAVLLGYAIGFLAAYRPDGWADVFSRALAIAGQALPAFAVGLVLLWIFGVQLRWINAFGGETPERIILPMMLVSLFSLGSVARLTHAGFRDVRQSPWYRTALAKGRSDIGALWHHGREAATVTLIAGLAPELAWIVGGTAVAEIVFGVPGLSERVVQAVVNRDYAVLQAYIALVALWMTVILHASRILQRFLDPRLQ
ncbi:ABC transporter permease [Granulosicoccus sp. 3-233]|uniref:ABC transporter permease n=1 Tax=Granulosicoccus sp. 3-233 TaxID=3417969 RepID=UPI003D34D0A9